MVGAGLKGCARAVKLARIQLIFLLLLSSVYLLQISTEVVTSRTEIAAIVSSASHLIHSIALNDL